MKWYFDTSVFVAAAVNTHPQYGDAIRVLKEWVAGRHQGIVSGHSLAEVYAVLTRTPFRNRPSVLQVMQSIESLMLSQMNLVTLTGAEYEGVIRRCAANGWTGGRVYDAIHVECAVKSDCDRLYTFNMKDFVALSGRSRSKGRIAVGPTARKDGPTRGTANRSDPTHATLRPIKNVSPDPRRSGIGCRKRGQNRDRQGAAPRRGSGCRKRGQNRDRQGAAPRRGSGCRHRCISC